MAIDSVARLCARSNMPLDGIRSRRRTGWEGRARGTNHLPIIVCVCVSVCVCVCVCPPDGPHHAGITSNSPTAHTAFAPLFHLSHLLCGRRDIDSAPRPAPAPPRRLAASPAVHPAGAAVAAPPPHLPQQRTARVTRTHQHRARHIRAMHQTFLAAPSPRTKWSTSSPHGRHSTLPHSLRSWRITGHPPSSPQWTP